jgi:hypothetical protein
MSGRLAQSVRSSLWGAWEAYLLGLSADTRVAHPTSPQFDEPAVRIPSSPLRKLASGLNVAANVLLRCDILDTSYIALPNKRSTAVGASAASCVVQAEYLPNHPATARPHLQLLQRNARSRCWMACSACEPAMPLSTATTLNVHSLLVVCSPFHKIWNGSFGILRRRNRWRKRIVLTCVHPITDLEQFRVDMSLIVGFLF